MNRYRFNFRSPYRWRNRWVALLLCGIAVGLAAALWLTAASPALAGWTPSYLTAQGVAEGVLLQWGTSSEFNVSGFEILCKIEGEADDAYDAIGSVPAAGGLDTPADYSFLADTNLTPGVSYCFRIREITFAEEPPEFRDICGYGINLGPVTASVTPTQTITTAGSVDVVGTAVFPLTPPPVQPIGGTPTSITIDPLTPVGDNTPLATAPATQTPIQPPQNATPSPTPTQFAESPLPSPTALEQTTDPESPLATPTDAAQNAAPNAVQNDAATSPLNGTDPAARSAAEAAPAAPAQQNDTAQSPLNAPALTSTATWTPLPPTPTQPSALAPQAVQPTANAGYIVVTATPTALDATPEATFTALPTATPQPDGQLMTGAANPTVENLILMTLCFIFLGAGGLGALGLTTTVLYIRSRNDRPS